jgi:uncharacterized protein HemY
MQLLVWLALVTLSIALVGLLARMDQWFSQRKTRRGTVKQSIFDNGGYSESEGALSQSDWRQS